MGKKGDPGIVALQGSGSGRSEKYKENDQKKNCQDLQCFNIMEKRYRWLFGSE